MATVIEQAVMGRRKSMEFLYETSKRKVYYVSLLLLGNERDAAEAVFYAFKNIWESITAHDIKTEEEFRHLAIRKAVDCCKRKIGRQNQKVFCTPQNRNFLVAGNTSGSDDCGNTPADILEQLPPLQRFIFVLHNVGDYSPEQIASTFRFDIKTVDLALKAERPNVERIMQCSDESTQAYEKIIGAMRDGEEAVQVPTVVDDRAAAVIDGIAAPLEKKKKKRITLIGVTALAVCVLVAGIVALVTRDNGVSTTAAAGDAADTAYTPAALDETLTYYADIAIADYGTITVQLDPVSAPITAANFVRLAESGFYDGLTFHRIIEGFMMQGGDPNGDGTGGSGNTIVGEFSGNGCENSLSHTRGAISMARSSDYDSASSPFFIVHEDSTGLDGQYAVFGYVTEGLEVVDAVCENAKPIDDNGTIEADAQPVITSVTIRTE